MTAREEILGRIRKSSATTSGNRQAEYRSIARDYHERGRRSLPDRLDLFTDRLLDYGCGVHGCAPHEIAASIAHILGERNRNRVLVAEDIPEEWLPEGVEFVHGAGLSYEAIDEVGCVLTRCAAAIAITGTIVLRHSFAAGTRALSLIPDYHLCCVFENQVEELVPEVFQQVSRLGDCPITTISGPSATSDIEMTRIQGVHGPRTLDVLIIATESGTQGATT